MLGRAMSRGFSLKADPGASPPAVLDEDGDEFSDAHEAHLHPGAHEDGGVAFADSALLEKQRRAILEVAKTLGKNLLTGNFDLLKISLPVKLFEPRSYLQKLADPWVYPRLLKLAAAQQDPVERLRWVVTYMAAGYHLAFKVWAKPFNPILAETWQAGLSDGSRIFIEQVSHHPPVSAFQLFGPGGAYVFHGLSQPSVAYKANAIKTSACGYKRLEFADGGAIDITFPAYWIKGLLYSAMPRAELVGIAEFSDRKNGLRVLLKFGKVEGAPAGSVLARSDALSGTIYRLLPSAAAPSASGAAPAERAIARTKSTGGSIARLARPFNAIRATASMSMLTGGGASSGPEPVDDGRVVIGTCLGNWQSHLDWEGTRYWTAVEEQAEEWQVDEDPLPSDARFREDLAALAAGDLVTAQAAKERLENLQRSDAKLRKEGAAWAR